MQIWITCINLLFGWDTIDYDVTEMQNAKLNEFI